MLLAAHIWHYWLGVAIVGLALVTTLALVVGYLVKVKAPQYPKPHQEP
jgi:hypothetical protein